MMRLLVLVVGLTFGAFASATTINDIMQTAAEQMYAGGDVDAMGFNFKVGDQAKYNMNMGFIKGSMTMEVKAVESDLVTIAQDVDLGFLGKQACEMQINPNTGETKKFQCNGQDQNTGGQDIELIESKEDTVKVPAGTFTCLYIKALEKKQNATIEQWANPKQVPVFGMVKMIVPSQIGQVTTELVSFKKN